MKRQFKKIPTFQDSERDVSLENTQMAASVSTNRDTMMSEGKELSPKDIQTAGSASLADYDTAVMPTIHQSPLPPAIAPKPFLPPAIAPKPSLPPAIVSKPPLPSTPAPSFFQRIVTTILLKAREPDPEKLSQTMFQRAIRLQNRPLGWLSLVLFIQASGILLVAYSAAASIHTATDQEIYLWLGMALIFASGFFRVLSPLASRMERITILFFMGVCIYLVPEILSPLHFIFVDEYMHLRTVNDIVSTGHLFGSNPVLPVSPLYPGLEIVTDALHSLSGLDVSTAGLIVVGMARVVVILTLFLLFEQIAKSPRTASIAAMIYGANSGFFMFDSLFLYEALGVALGAVMLFALYRSEKADKSERGLLFVACIALGALTITHHVSDIFFVALLVIWTIAHIFTRQPLFRSYTLEVVLLGLLFSVIWILFFAEPVIGYLAVPVTSALAQLQSVLTGSGLGRHFFIDHTGAHPTPLLSQLVMLASVGLVTLGIPFSFLCLWHRYRQKAFPFALALISLLYPFTQALRVTGQSANVPDRASPYIFIAVSFALATLITQMWPVQKLKWKKAIMITLLASLVFLGGNMLGAGPGWRLMPSGYLVGDDGSSVTPEGINAALWALEHLGPNNRFYGDSTNALLMNAYGEQRIVSLPVDGVDVSPVYYDAQLHSFEIWILRSAQVRYLVVDRRLSTGLPAKGYYFEGYQEPDVNITTPMNPQALAKFNKVPQLNRIFDSGNITIYDTSELLNGS